MGLMEAPRKPSEVATGGDIDALWTGVSDAVRKGFC